MVRPTKFRYIENLPSIISFTPSKNRSIKGPKNILNFEELEAVRLKDLEHLDQQKCSERMQVSRPTFHRILLSARTKISDCLVNGKTIHIEGGNFTQNICSFTCLDCNSEWVERIETMLSSENENYICPYCGSSNIRCNQTCRARFGRRNCQHHGHSNY